MTANPIESASTGGVRELPATEARNQLSELLDAVRDGEFVYLTRRGRRVAALLPADIAENYETIEDEYWVRRAAEAEDSGRVSWEQGVAELESRQA
ncbi:MAG: type II toxin-antitoxin system prevent-host-death family antitoxin [Pseudonocardiaceae bacterium]|nr:type II toxin-antitoxin system prevent-host-death family antitoxin [Pseudonocardiaceae bacterium]